MKVKEIIGNNSIWIPNKKYNDVKPLVSVLLPTYSRAKSGLLTKCLDSVLNQSFRRLELIIVIDASTDGTYQICKRYMERDSRVNIILHKENMALPAISTYEAYMKSRGEYMAYAFDDNVWELDALAKTYDFMEENDIKASYGIAKVRDPRTGQFVEFGANLNSINGTIWMGNQIGAGSVVLHREVLEKVGLHDPHLALTRVCDWDLWLRICKLYPFVGTNISFTEEHGVSQPDSLGNAFKLDHWFIRERQQHRDEYVLHPQNYLDADVLEINEWSSTHYRRCLEEHYEQYKLKSWYDDAELNMLKNQDSNKEHFHILVIYFGDKDGSVMNLDRYRGKTFTFFHCKFNNIIPSVLALSDLAIFVRFIKMGSYNELCKKLSIPCYYFVDDNFKEIVIDNAGDQWVRAVAQHTTRETLSQFEGIIVTTKALQNYFVKNKLHDRIFMLSAISNGVLQGKKNSDTLTIGFMGGDFRMNTLTKCILPALYKISSDQHVRLICPYSSGNKDDVMALESNGLEVIPFQRNPNYEYAVNAYNEYGVDIFVHCGGNNRNNYYKTKNALINAVSLGAPLIVSDIEPYCDTTDGSDGSYLLVRNTPESWLKALTDLSKSKKLREELFNRAVDFCEKTYGWEMVWRLLSEEFLRCDRHEDFYFLKRYELLCDWLLQNANQEVFATLSLPSGYRVYDPNKLSFSGELKGIRRYGFTATKARISEIGLLFVVFGECIGQVVLTIRRTGSEEALSKKSIQIDQLKPDAYTNIFLENTINAKVGEILFLDIEVCYEEKNGYVGVFEDVDRRTFFYKVFNKLGHPIPGRDALFIDCRS